MISHGIGLRNIKKSNCSVCNQQFPSIELRNNHVNNIRAFVILYCKECGFVGTPKDSTTHHDYFLFCIVCKSFIFEHFWSHKCLHEKHVQDLASKTRKSCHLCQDDLFTELDATNHILVCKLNCEKKTIAFECQCCHKEFPNEDRLKSHLSHFKKDDKIFLHRCTSCNISFDNVDEYMSHLLQAHLSSISTPKFNKVIRSKKKSKCHRNRTLQRSVSCRFCKSQFSSKNIATFHERTQHGGETVECPLCFKQLKLEKMKGHNTTHRTRKCYQNSPIRICNICGISVKNLPRHLTSHRNERKYKCSICAKDFKLAWDMKKHLLTHVGEAKHKCVVCGKGFKVAYNLKVHMRIHDSVKPFSCVVCEKTFTTKQSRDIHLKIHDRMNFDK